MIALKKKHLRRFVPIVLAMVIFMGSLSASAEGFYHYGYNRDGEPIEAPAAVEASFSITGESAGTTDFSNAQDLFIADDGTIYVADTGNNRIVLLDKNGKFLKETTAYVDCKTGKKEKFSKPSGIFVNANNDVYICDSGNERVVQLSQDGTNIMNVALKTADVLPKDFKFRPTKISVDHAGRIFVVSEGYNNGLLEFSQKGEYVQSMGASKTALTASELFWRVLQTKKQRAKSSSSVSTEYNNVEIDKEGFLFVTSSAYEYWQYKEGKIQALRKLNAKGADVLITDKNVVGDLEYPDEKLSRNSYKGPSLLVDVCSLEYGNYAVLDQKRGRVFVYNADGERMYNFGGPGDFNGGMSVPTALDYHNGRYIVMDADKNQISVYTVTDYGKLFEDVSRAKHEIDYKTEETLWNKIINENSNCEQAMKGLGDAAYRKQDMKTAMQYYHLAEDRENYSKAYIFVRREWLENNAVWLLLVIALFITGMVLLKKYWKKCVAKSEQGSYISCLDFAGYVAFHPIRGFWRLKRENRGSVGAAFTFLACLCVVQVVSAMCTGFIFNKRDLSTYNMFVDIGIILAGITLWCISQWCVTVLMNGEGKFKDIFIATCYAAVPYIWLNLAAMIVSRVLSLDEAEFYAVLIGLGIVYSVFLLVMSVMSVHDFSMKKTLLVILIVSIILLLILFIVMLLITLSSKMFLFVKDLYNEITLRL